MWSKVCRLLRHQHVAIQFSNCRVSEGDRNYDEAEPIVGRQLNHWGLKRPGENRLLVTSKFGVMCRKMFHAPLLLAKEEVGILHFAVGHQMASTKCLSEF